MYYINRDIDPIKWKTLDDKNLIFYQMFYNLF